MRRNIGFALLTMVLVLVTGCSLGGVAMCRPGGIVRVNEGYYTNLEEEYVREVKHLLQEAGLKDAGVMLTHVREADGTRIYTLNVHHRNYSLLKQQDRERLSSAVRACSFETEQCVFVQKYDGTAQR